VLFPTAEINSRGDMQDSHCYKRLHLFQSAKKGTLKIKRAVEMFFRGKN
jgi:hypothetical protein